MLKLMTFSILLQLFLSAGTAQEVPVVLSVGGQNETGFLTNGIMPPNARSSLETRV